MANKNSSFIGEAVDSVIIGGLAYYLFKGIFMIFKIILLIIFWPIALLLKVKPKR